MSETLFWVETDDLFHMGFPPQRRIWAWSSPVDDPDHEIENAVPEKRIYTDYLAIGFVEAEENPRPEQRAELFGVRREAALRHLRRMVEHDRGPVSSVREVAKLPKWLESELWGYGALR